MSAGNSGRKDYRNRGRTYPGGYQRAAPTDGVRILTYGPHTNYIEWRRELNTALEHTYGNLGHSAATGVLWQPEQVEYDESELTTEKDPHGLKAAVIGERMKNRARQQEKVLEDIPKIYAYIISKISTSSFEAIQRHEDYSRFDQRRDFLALLRAIERYHCFQNTGDTARDRDKALQLYMCLKMEDSESLLHYKERFVHTISSMKLQGCDVPDEAQQVYRYLNSLHSRYEPIVSNLLRAKRMYGDNYTNFPLTIMQAYDEVQRGVVEFKIQAPNNNNATRNTRVAFFAKSGKQEKSDKKREKGKFSDSDKKCVICEKNGHWASQCPSLAQAKAAVKGDSSAGSEKSVLIANGKNNGIYVSKIPTDCQERVGPNHVLLDNQASASIFVNKDLLYDIEPAEKPITVHGIGGEIVVDEMGVLEGIGKVYYCPKCPTNILSFSEMQSHPHLSVGYDEKKDYFTLKFKEEERQAIKFRRLHKNQGSLYVHKVDTENAFMITTVSGREALYSKREVEEAQEAQKLVERLGYPSYGEVRELITTGGIVNSRVTVQALSRAEHIYGTPIAAIKGKTTQRKASIYQDVPSEEKETRTKQELHSDIMFVCGQMFLISVAIPMKLLMSCHLQRKNEAELKSAIDSHINILHAHGFFVPRIHFDGEPGINALSESLAGRGIEVVTAAPGTHVAHIERQIRTVKERVRSVLSSLPYELPPSLLHYAVAFVISRINSLPPSTAFDKTSPRELLLGRKLDGKRDISLSFGQYVQVYRPHTVKNSMEPRTEAAIALLPTNNLQGAHKFYLIKSKKIVTRDQWLEVPLPIELVEELNAIAASERQKDTPTIGEEEEEEHMESNTGVPATEEPRHRIIRNGDPPTYAGPHEEETQSGQEQQEIQQENYTLPPHLDIGNSILAQDPIEEIQENISRDAEIQDEEDFMPVPPVVYDEEAVDFDHSADHGVASQEEEEPHYGRRLVETSEGNLLRSTRPHKAPSKYSFVIDAHHNVDATRGFDYAFHISVREGIGRFGEAAKQAILAEFKQLANIPAWMPVRYKELESSQKTKIIRALLFLKDKYKADGTFDKIKARLVARGDLQSGVQEEDKSSPTASLAATLMHATIAAAERRHVATVDVTGAFLNAPMDEQEVFIKLDRQQAEFACEVEPKYREYKNDDGTLIVRLKRALYGCQQASLLWFETLTKTLKGLGFTANEYEQCVFNRGTLDEGNQVTITVYVDDLFISTQREGDLKRILDELRDALKNITVHEGKVHSYLGMTFDFSTDGLVKISMAGYIEDLLRESMVAGGDTVVTPATGNLLKVDEDAEKLDIKASRLFHTNVAKLLYLGKRCRPDILLAVNFLAGRVTQPTVEDQRKLERIIKYLRGTKEFGICLGGGEGNKIELSAHIDASYAAHEDARGQSGIVISIGKGPVLVKSIKQKLVARSSTESELIGLAEGLGQVIWCRNFLLSQGYQMPPATIFQDNQSTIALVHKGKSTSDATKHIKVRYFFIHDNIMDGEVKLEYKSTQDMIADILTKPLQGQLFYNLRGLLLNSEN